MSPEDVEKIKVGIRDEYLEMLADEDDQELMVDLRDSLNDLNKVFTFKELMAFMKEEGDQEQALGWILFGLCKSADMDDLMLFEKTVWSS